MDRTGPNGNQVAALEWLPYQELLYKALRLAGGSKDDLCYTMEDKLQVAAWAALWPQERVRRGPRKRHPDCAAQKALLL